LWLTFARTTSSIWLTGSLDLPTAEEMAAAHLYANLSERKLASVAIYGMLVRLARLTFFANPQRFGLIVLEEAGALLNSRAGADDAHLISRRARKHFTGLLIITQNPVDDLALTCCRGQSAILRHSKVGPSEAVLLKVTPP
jgi:hypothetical protein